MSDIELGRCSPNRKTLRGECYGAAGWHIVADSGSKVRSFGQWAAANCAALPTTNASQYVTLHCKPLLIWFPISGGI